MTPDLLPAEAARLAAENARLRERVEALARECRAWREEHSPPVWQTMYPGSMSYTAIRRDAVKETDRLRALEGP